MVTIFPLYECTSKPPTIRSPWMLNFLNCAAIFSIPTLSGVSLQYTVKRFIVAQLQELTECVSRVSHRGSARLLELGRVQGEWLQTKRGWDVGRGLSSHQWCDLGRGLENFWIFGFKTVHSGTF